MPALRFPEFTDAWEQRKLDDILTERHILSKISDEYPRLSIKKYRQYRQNDGIYCFFDAFLVKCYMLGSS